MAELQDDVMATPECYFCGTAGHPLVNKIGLESVIVRASDETPEEAQERYVCNECNPKKDGRDD